MTAALLTSSLLILAVAGLRRLLRGKTSLRLQYALWLLVALRLLCPVALPASPVSVMNVALPVLEEWAAPRAAEALAVPVEPDAPEAIPARPAPTVTGAAVERALKPVWYAGMAAVGGCLLVSNLLFARRLRKRRVLTEYGDRRLPVYRAEGLPSPCLFGVFTPAVYLTPESMADERGLKHTLAHERTHKRHGDQLWSFVRGLCLTVWWFNPLVWWAAALSRRDGELACDEGTIARLGEEERLPYGRTLVALTAASRGPADLLSGATTMTGGKGSLRERVRLLAKRPRMWVGTLAVVLALAAALAVCTFTGASGVFELKKGSAIRRALTAEEEKIASQTGMTVWHFDYALEDDAQSLWMNVALWTEDGLYDLYGGIGGPIDEELMLSRGSLSVAYNRQDTAQVHMQLGTGAGGLGSFQVSLPDMGPALRAFTATALDSGEPWVFSTGQPVILCALRYTGAGDGVLEGHAAERLMEDPALLMEKDVVALVVYLVPDAGAQPMDWRPAGPLDPAGPLAAGE